MGKRLHRKKDASHAKTETLGIPDLRALKGGGLDYDYAKKVGCKYGREYK